MRGKQTARAAALPASREEYSEGVCMFRTLLLTVAVLLLCSCVANAQASEFTIVVLPDTQYYSQNNPAIFNRQTQWIADNAASLNIQLVLHEGDLVNKASSTTQWANADNAMKVLDSAGVPYIAVIGNRDYSGNSPSGRTAKATAFNTYFGPSRYAGKPYSLTSYSPGSNENFYSTFTLGGQQFLVLALEFYPRQAVLDWANAVVAANPDKEVVLLTHSYTYGDNTRVGRCDADGKEKYNLVSDNDGDQVWDKLVRRHANFSLVLSGHITWKSTGRRADVGDNGNLVNQVFADYQAQTNGGNGYLRIMTFHPSINSIDVKTYSPWLDTYYTDARNQFTLKWHADAAMSGQPSLIEGRVRSAADCSVIAKAPVTANDAAVAADSNGVFALTTMFTSPTVTASPAGWICQGLQISAPQGAGAQAEFFLMAGGKIEGSVNDLGGFPVANASIAVSDGSTPINTSTDSNGKFATDWILPGSYSVTASTTSGNEASTTASVSAGQSSSVALTLPLESTGRTLLTGKITSALDGSALSGATVTAGGSSTLSDSTGTYSIADLATGTYTVTSTKSNFGTYSVSAAIADGTITTANILMAPTGRATGTAYNADGTPAATILVRFVGGVIPQDYSVRTSTSGTFTTKSLPVGQYTASVTNKSGVTTSVNLDIVKGVTTPITLTLAP
jgi:hypothetical protein